MKLIIGLGNIDEHFNGTRHNVGFTVLNSVATAQGTRWQMKDKFKALVAEYAVQSQKVLLIKPTTYYNLSGEAAQAIRHFYKIDVADILVVHDELALPFGAVRTRIGGSDAGNNGLKSIIAAVGAGVARVRIGIHNDLAAQQDAADFVLAKFTTEETQKWPDIQKHAVQYITAFIQDSFEHTTAKVG